MKDNYKDPSGADYTGKTITSQYTLTLGRDEPDSSSQPPTSRHAQQGLRRGRRRRAEHRLRPLVLRHLLDPSRAPRNQEGQAGVVLGDPPSARSSTPAPGPSPRTSRRDQQRHREPVPRPRRDRRHGRRTVGFSTNEQTKDQTYTARVQNLDTTVTSRYNTVDIAIGEGDVTITTAVDPVVLPRRGNCLSGTNASSDTIDLFVDRLGCSSAGRRLTDMASSSPVTPGNFPTTEAVELLMQHVAVPWSTANLNIERRLVHGHAVSSPNNRDNLAGQRGLHGPAVVRRRRRRERLGLDRRAGRHPGDHRHGRGDPSRASRSESSAPTTTA